jgi:hypothetical protein
MQKSASYLHPQLRRLCTATEVCGAIGNADNVITGVTTVEELAFHPSTFTLFTLLLIFSL